LIRITPRISTAVLTGALLFGLSACASEPTSPGATTAPPATTTAAPTPTVTAASFCTELTTFANLQKQALTTAIAGQAQPQAAVTLRDQANRVNAAVPPELRTDWETVKQGVDLIAAQIENPSADFNGKLTTMQQNQVFVAAALRLFTYAQSTCKIDVSDMFGTK